MDIFTYESKIKCSLEFINLNQIFEEYLKKKYAYYYRLVSEKKKIEIIRQMIIHHFYSNFVQPDRTENKLLNINIGQYRNVMWKYNQDILVIIPQFNFYK
jgi:hypothetical protein